MKRDKGTSPRRHGLEAVLSGTPHPVHLLLLLFLLGSIQASTGALAGTLADAGTHAASLSSVPVYSIRDDATGGDCTLIGTWDGANNTCTLCCDQSIRIDIQSDNVTLDGAGHALTGDDTGYGVVLMGRTGVRIKNLAVRHFRSGIMFLYGAAYNVVEDVVASDNEYGVDCGDTGNHDNTWRRIEAYRNVGGLMAYAGSNNLRIEDCVSHDNASGIQIGFSSGWRFERNEVHHNGHGIIIDTASDGYIADCSIHENTENGILFGGWYPVGNQIERNRIYGNQIGFGLYCAATGNVCNDNVVVDNQIGVKITSNDACINYGNRFYRNDFDNVVNTEVLETRYAHYWDNGLPDGGNFWGDYHTAQQGCTDGDGNGFCDAPYVFAGGPDNYPRTEPVCGRSPDCSVNEPPDCSQAWASIRDPWPPARGLMPVGIAGVTDPDGDPLTITVIGVTQDEPVSGMGDGETCPDAVIVDGAAQLRLERSGKGDGRVYAIAFTATDGKGGECRGTVTVCVPHDQRAHASAGAGSGLPGKGVTPCHDDGQQYNSLAACEVLRPRAKEEIAAGRLGIGKQVSEGNNVSLEYSLPRVGEVELSVYDIAGRRVADLVQDKQGAGTHRVSWSTAGLRAGVYFYRLKVEGAVVSRALIVTQ